jgi:hypothetical protein
MGVGRKLNGDAENRAQFLTYRYTPRYATLVTFLRLGLRFSL